jgi:hypothetical protein
MKNIEELKKEQSELKEKLHEIVELVNSEEYFKLPDGEKGLINQQRVGMELYLSCLTKRIYGNSSSPDTSNLIWLSMLYGMFNTSSGFGSPSSTEYLKDQLKESDFETKEETI